MKNFVKRNRLICITIAIMLVMGLINLICWNSADFCDFYTKNIFPVFVGIFSRITSLFSFSVGEIMIIIAICIVLISPILYIILMIAKKGKRKLVTLVFARIFLVIFAFISTVMTLNCTILYHCTRLQDKSNAHEYTYEEFMDAYCLVLIEMQKLAPLVSRDEHYQFVLSDDLSSTARAAMTKLGDTIPRLSGFYPDLKPITHSFFMSQEYLAGVYFPFSLEANYNSAMLDINLPSTGCHELAHLKGFIQEDEANFISFLACINSDSVDFQYSGYVSAYEYLENELFDIYGEMSEEESDALYAQAVEKYPEIVPDFSNPQYYTYDIYCFLPENYWEENEHHEIIPTEIVDEISDIATDTSLKLNGVEDGSHSYSRVVELLISHYKDEIKW